MVRDGLMGLRAFLKRFRLRRRTGIRFKAPPSGKGDRFLVERVGFDGERMCAYAGDDGVKAIEAWEACRAWGLPGTYTFYDRVHPAEHRGQFTLGAV